MIDKTYPRDMVGYGRNPPDAAWPDGASSVIASARTWPASKGSSTAVRSL